jgi:hypothetical protein
LWTRQQLGFSSISDEIVSLPAYRVRAPLRVITITLRETCLLANQALAASQFSMHAMAYSEPENNQVNMQRRASTPSAFRRKPSNFLVAQAPLDAAGRSAEPAWASTATACV